MQLNLKLNSELKNGQNDRGQIIIVGVDPGIKGGICIIAINKKAIENIKLFKLDSLQNKTAYEYYQEVISIFKDYNDIYKIALERPFGRQEQGNTVEYARRFGWLEMTLSGLKNTQIELFYPSQWQAIIFNRHKKVSAKQKAAELFKCVTKSEQKHSGIIDAFCIAYSFCLKNKIL